ncbi:glycosyltransferase family 4 protein [Flavobacterium sp. I-SCBP12n]|uniref:Glycosyltransferase family 4 protein n=1 Tax=Flavobacterium pygoscelis TaxID=2893176 RepID=A0A9X2BKX0_9FLAO|nr:glycosyltransferase family 4 protein [Flavobacterium pygoscelis]MCK8141457.1 glycosyltransferase family 4 protein [Flavobacterium pygoscelis]
MNIAVILPKLVSEAPVLVAKDLIEQIHDKVSLIDIYYFDGENEVGFQCNCYKVSFFEPFDFDKYDIIHTHTLKPDLYIWKHRRKIKNAKCISTIHNYVKAFRSIFNLVTAFCVGKIWLLALRHQDAIVVLSENMKSEFSVNLDEKKMRVIYNGRRLSEDLLNVKFNNEDDKKIKVLRADFKIIGVSARLNKIKGFSQLIKALPNLKDYALIFIGDGEEKENLITLASELGVIDRCLFLGYRKNGYLYLPYFDIFAMTSFSEGFPLGLLEAGKFKLPVVCSDLPIFKELFDESEVVFFELNNIKSLEKSITLLYENRDFFSLNIFNKVSQNYTVENMAKNYLSLYNELLDL